MKQLYFVANWKSNKTVDEAKNWMTDFSRQLSAIRLPKYIHIIICAPFTVLSPLHDEIQRRNIPIHIGAQDISPFTKGAFTGEISADMMKGIISYVLIGHSERRQYFQEKQEELSFEVLQAHSAGFQIIYCISDADDYVPEEVDCIAYEPVEAIGSGKPQMPGEAQDVCAKIQARHPGKPVLYGGSITEKNADQYIRQLTIQGVLVGGASLDPEKFFQIIKSASSYA